MKSHALLRTNVSLTTNVKIVVDSSSNIYYDSIPSIPQLNDVGLKKFRINTVNSIEFSLPEYWKSTLKDYAFALKVPPNPVEDMRNMGTDFSKQFDDIYFAGARNIGNNKDYDEEFEYFAPLHISKNNLPKYFIIFRVDGTGNLNLTKNNFKTEILEKMKVVKVFDLLGSTPIGNFLNNSIVKNTSYPLSSLDVRFWEQKFSLTGIKYPSKPGESNFVTLFQNLVSHTNLDGLPFYTLQKSITQTYRSLGVIYPHILNLNFLFDDTPATPTTLRKWSLNRYLGFYFDNLVLEMEVTPSILPKMKPDVVIGFNNIVESISGGDIFLNSVGLTDLTKFIEIEGKVYEIKECPECNTFSTQTQQTTNNTTTTQLSRDKVTRYKIISDIDLFGKPITQKPTNEKIKIVFEENENRLKLNDDSKFEIDNFDRADLWLIKINGDFFKLKKNVQGFICIHTDYAFEQKEDKIDYYINDPDPKTRKSFKIILQQTLKPVVFSIYRCQFTDIKDFDNDIVETEYSKFEYDRESSIVNTEEPKMYVKNSELSQVDSFKIGNEVIYLPAASEYTSNQETFEIIKHTNGQFYLTSLWYKNPDFVKWGYEGSNDINDYPYYLTLSEMSQSFNRSTNFIDSVPRRVQKNLDYFYTVNSSTSSYSHHSLHVEDHITEDFDFELDKYLGLNYDSDYFTYFFGKKSYLNNSKIVKNTKKWSYFQPKIQFPSGTNGAPSFFTPPYTQGVGETKDVRLNKTLFRGLSFELGSWNTLIDDEYAGYKFAIILTKNKYTVSPNFSSSGTVSSNRNPNAAFIQRLEPTLIWQTIKPFDFRTLYSPGDIVRRLDTLFRAKEPSSLSSSGLLNLTINKDPWSDPIKWEFFTQSTIFWTPNLSSKRKTDNSRRETLPGSPPVTRFVYPDSNMSDFGNYPNLINRYGVYWYYKFWTESSGNISESNSNAVDFWIPSYRQTREESGNTVIMGYPQNSRVYHKDGFWTSLKQLNLTEPGTGPDWVKASLTAETIIRLTDFKWLQVQPFSLIIFSQGNVYYDALLGNPSLAPTPLSNRRKKSFYVEKGKYCFYNDVVYVSSKLLAYVVSGNQSDVKSPETDSGWLRVYSFLQKDDFSYGTKISENNIVSQNYVDKICIHNTKPSTPDPSVKYLDKFDDGVTIYINKKHKNILINLYVNDNFQSTFRKVGTDYVLIENIIKNKNRDRLYISGFDKFTASNLWKSMAYTKLKWGFTNFLNYVVIGETGELSLFREGIDGSHDMKNRILRLRMWNTNTEIKVLDSYKILQEKVTKNILKPKRELINTKIEDTTQINYYSNFPIANIGIYVNPNGTFWGAYWNIRPGLNTYPMPKINTFYRHSGIYSPIFKEIQLFKASTSTESHNNFIFDTELTDFGMSGEIIVSKVNSSNSVLKLSNNTNQFSIYPMVDEFGYHSVRKFIFKSTWDFEYFYECIDVDQIDPLQTLTSVSNEQPNQT